MIAVSVTTPAYYLKTIYLARYHEH